MDQSDLLRRVTAILQRLNLPHYVTGSYALFFYGEPRLTNDIDIVVDLPINRVSAFCSAFDPSEYYLSEDAVRDAVLHCFMFNIIHQASMSKIDIMIPKNTSFDKTCLLRATRLQPEPDYEASFASPEDVILNKLLFHQEGGSEKHLRDIASVLKISGEKLDKDYLEKWARELGVIGTWQAILKKAQNA